LATSNATPVVDSVDGEIGWPFLAADYWKSDSRRACDNRRHGECKGAQKRRVRSSTRQLQPIRYCNL